METLHYEYCMQSAKFNERHDKKADKTKACAHTQWWRGMKAARGHQCNLKLIHKARQICMAKQLQMAFRAGQIHLQCGQERYKHVASSKLRCVPAACSSSS